MNDRISRRLGEIEHRLNPGGKITIVVDTPENRAAFGIAEGNPSPASPVPQNGTRTTGKFRRGRRRSIGLTRDIVLIVTEAESKL